MQKRISSPTPRNIIAIAAMSLALGGCLMDEEKSVSDEELLSDNTVTGSVGDGPLVGAAMRILARDGTLLAELESDTRANYAVTVRTRGGSYPLTIDARDGVDLVTNAAPDFILLGAVLRPDGRSVANINPFTTLIVELARDLPGGIDEANLATAQARVVAAVGSGLSSLAATGPMTTPIDAGNVAEIVRASELLGEIVRRTRDLQLMFSRPSSGDTVIRAMASDLVDGIMDGIGGSRTDARTSAIASVVAVQVLLESMQNELHVNGVDATSAMNAAVDRVTGGAAGTMIDDLVVTPGMLEAAGIGFEALLAVIDDAGLAALRDALAGIPAGMDPLLIRSLIPDDYRTILEGALIEIAGSDDTTITEINDVVRGGGQPLPVNQAPTISGTPVTSAVEGMAYAFTPSASDPNGDLLTFTISGQPVWASFDSRTGELAGTPRPGDAATYANIVIAVSDGEFVTNLPMFSIIVTAVPPANSPPSISGNPVTSINANSNYSFRPTATDPDGDTLTFAILGKPAWADFNTASGVLSGVPGAGDVGIYGDIRISVSDSAGSSASLTPFSIAVNALGTGSVTLSWTPPTENEDGTALTDLAGYRIYWGTSSGSYPNSVSIDNAGITSYVVEGLAAGTYTFVATAYNASGIESSYSSPATKIVP